MNEREKKIFESMKLLNSLTLKFLLITWLLFLSWGLFAQTESTPDPSIVMISNEDLLVNITTLGAELQNIIAHNTGREYLWQGDSAYWGRRAPILFPFIGRLWDGGYTLDGKRYVMGIHGFAKDYEFKLIRKKENEAWFRLTSNDQILEIYPFLFELTIGYILESNKLKVICDVRNTGPSEISFQIGGHPGFIYPDFNAADVYHAYLKFEQTGTELSYVIKDSSGFLNPNPVRHQVQLDEDGFFPVSQELFIKDAVIFENYQARKVTVFNLQKEKYLSIEFDMPVFTLWSNPDKKAPFICIEPLWGRIDEYNMTKDMRDRVWTQHVSSKERFLTSYVIEIF